MAPNNFRHHIITLEGALIIFCCFCLTGPGHYELLNYMAQANSSKICC